MRYIKQPTTKCFNQSRCESLPNGKKGPRGESIPDGGKGTRGERHSTKRRLPSDILFCHQQRWCPDTNAQTMI